MSTLPTTPAKSEPLLSFAEGAEMGVSDWVTITQDMIDQFGTLTRDPDPLHVDPAWAAANGPFGSTVSFGFLTISLLTHLVRQVVVSDMTSVEHGLLLNYGFDRLRLVAPVAVNKRVRGRFVSGGMREDTSGRIIKTTHATIEIEGEDRPAVVAEWLAAWVPPAAGGGISI